MPQRLALIDYSLPSTSDAYGSSICRRPVCRTPTSRTVATAAISSRPLFPTATAGIIRSLGLVLTADTYIGGNGYSLRMEGQVPGINDKARARALVMHGARHVVPALASDCAGPSSTASGTTAHRHAQVPGDRESPIRARRSWT
ncbi:murein L,D-transpeptidase catalytic domain-containing protein [Lysobacter sp. Hz 25]|uniref:murein L,D-transpeptidase catalytic domain-containing protein n=1 Tax=Lysobacter sp. Hz 25 TaxID=3383698 RepID=UPI0038D4A00A